MHRLTVTAALLLLLSGSAAFAQSNPDAQPYPAQAAKGKASKGTKQQKDACFRDANRFCADEIPEGDMQVLGCLKTHRAKLSKGCEKVLSENGQ